MTDYYQLLGDEALRYVCNPQANLLIYSEVEDGAISCDIFFLSQSEDEVQFRFATPEIKNLVYSYWKSGQGPVKPESWAVLRFTISNGKFAVEHEYSDKLAPNEDLPERRPSAVAEIFQNIRINYSKPKG